MAQDAYQVAEADFRVLLDGTDLTDKIRPRLSSLSLVEKRGDEADQLDIVIDDSDARMALPKTGAVLTVQLGWARGSEVTPGLIDKGRFTVDEISHEGPPDRIIIRARSADFTSAIRTRREKSWRNTTLGTIVKEVAGRNQLAARVAPALANVAIASLTQSRESDMALLKRLGREHDAVATVKRGALIFAKVGAGTTTGGTSLPAVTIRRRDGDRHSYSVTKREEAAGVSASWHDRKGAKRKTVTVGETEGAKQLARTYPSEAEARRAATAERDRIARDPVKLSFDLALGRPDIYPEQRATVSGFKAEIDATKWLIVEVAHTLTDRGLVTGLTMEATV